MNLHAPSIPLLAFSLDEAASAIRISRRSIYNLIDAGTLRTVKIGRRRLVPRDELERLCRAGANV